MTLLRSDYYHISLRWISWNFHLSLATCTTSNNLNRNCSDLGPLEWATFCANGWLQLRRAPTHIIFASWALCYTPSAMVIKFALLQVLLLIRQYANNIYYTRDVLSVFCTAPRRGKNGFATRGWKCKIEFTCGVAGQIGGAVQDKASRTMEHGRVAQTTALHAGGHMRVGHLQRRAVNG